MNAAVAFGCSGRYAGGLLDFSKWKEIKFLVILERLHLLLSKPKSKSVSGVEVSSFKAIEKYEDDVELEPSLVVTVISMLSPSTSIIPSPLVQRYLNYCCNISSNISLWSSLPQNIHKIVIYVPIGFISVPYCKPAIGRYSAMVTISKLQMIYRSLILVLNLAVST